MQANPWNIGGKDAFLVGELRCRKCKAVVDVIMGGVEEGHHFTIPKWYCPQCKGEDANWVNEIRAWDTRFCMFTADERPEL